MADNALKIEYKLYLEAEDVSQSRILSSASYLENVLHNHANPYIKCAQIDNESDLDEFELRLYVDEAIEEADCANADAAEAFLDEFYQKLRTFIPLWIWREAFLFPLRESILPMILNPNRVTVCVTLWNGKKINTFFVFKNGIVCYNSYIISLRRH